MTKEQIEELRAWCNSDNYDYPDHDAVAKALDEREALLTALRTLRATAYTRGACTTPACLRGYLAAADAYNAAGEAIAIADAP